MASSGTQSSEHRLAANGPSGPDNEMQRRKNYSTLFRRFILWTTLCSIVPLLLVGWVISLQYTRFTKERMLNSLQTQVEHHRKTIEMFLSEHSSKLWLIAASHPKNHLIRSENLNAIFEMINRDHWAITDLGVIGANGSHLAYVGPYDLMSKNYYREFWFEEVMAKGIYISDMFMGFRKEPHFVIAVRRIEGEDVWILRATINTDLFRSLVESVQIGKTGEVYLLNRDGVFQTTPRFGGSIMSRAAYPVDPVHDGIRVRSLDSLKDIHGRPLPRQIVCQAWLTNPRWLMVVKQNYSEAFTEVNHANVAVLVFLHLSALTILVAAVLISRHMIGIVRRRDAQADQLNEQLLQTGKLAAIGELSAGVAHEINNPLAIILTERQLLLDAAAAHPVESLQLQAQLTDSLTQIDVQVQRCKRITQNLLRFSRRTESLIETIDLNAFITEVIDLMQREAKASGIKFLTELDPDLPPLLSDPSQLQQVLLNLVTNSIDAHNGKPYGSIRLGTRADDERQSATITVADTGCGIAARDLTRIFDPFFTTKPVGKGTGLGLSICYSIVKRLGGFISVASEPGQGTEFTVVLPYQPPAELREHLKARKADAVLSN